MRFILIWKILNMQRKVYHNLQVYIKYTVKLVYKGTQVHLKICTLWAYRYIYTGLNYIHYLLMGNIRLPLAL
jgi:hypothetical protein